MEDETKVGESPKIPRRRRRKSLWSKVRNVLHSLYLLNNQAVISIDDADRLDQEFEVVQTPRMDSPEISPKKQKKPETTLAPLEKRDDRMVAFQEAVTSLRNLEKFCECATIGGPHSLAKMVDILNRHPSKYSREPEDPEHLINKHNKMGCNALYLAAKNGNLTIVKFLIETGANPHILSKVRLFRCRFPEINIIFYPVRSMKRFSRSRLKQPSVGISWRLSIIW